MVERPEMLLATNLVFQNKKANKLALSPPALREGGRGRARRRAGGRPPLLPPGLSLRL